LDLIGKLYDVERHAEKQKLDPEQRTRSSTLAFTSCSTWGDGGTQQQDHGHQTEGMRLPESGAPQGQYETAAQLSGVVFSTESAHCNRLEL